MKVMLMSAKKNVVSNLKDSTNIYLAIGKVEGIELPPNTTFLVAGHILTNSVSIIEELIEHKPEFEIFSGAHFVGQIYNGGVFLICKHQFKSSFEQDTSLFSKQMNLTSYTMKLLIDLLWFTVDNSCCIRDVFFYRKTPFRVHGCSIESISYNSQGNFNLIGLSEKKVANWNETVNRYNVLAALKAERPATEAKVNFLSPTQSFTFSNEAAINYNSLTRISRAWMFIIAARSASILPLRIANYIGCLEALFSTDNGELTHQVSERIVCYINPKNKYGVYNFIKECYDIRSKYVHGDSIKDKKLSIMHYTNFKLENIIRRVFYKIYSDKGAPFYKEKDDLREHFIRLILNHPLKASTHFQHTVKPS